MAIYLPNRKFLRKTGEVDYFHWNYQFPVKYIQRFRFGAIVKLMGDRIYRDLLEVGTGSGVFLPELAKHCQNLYAMDVHDHMDSVEKLCQTTSVKAELNQFPVEHTDYADDMFDCVVAVSVLEFVDDLEEALREIKRIMKPDGIFLTICPQESALLDSVLSLYTRRKPEEEFKISRTRVSPTLEAQFLVIEKHIFPPIIGKILPVYVYYKLGK